jgi:ATP-dependent Lon protease
MDLRLKGVALQKIDQLNSLDPSSGEYFKMMTWIENLCKLPIGKYKNLPIEDNDDIQKISEFLDTVKQNLDDKVYGHQTAKNQIVRLLAKWISNPSSKGLVIGIEGAMGQGKTSLCNAICESLSLPFGFLQLGGISDGSYLIGHSYTYEGSRWGRIAEILMKVGCMNPVLYFDELDKISTTRHGEEIANMLIHLTDSSQNNKFHDKYFSDIELDLSRCLIIFSYNHSEMVNPILKDRMITIKTDGYTHKDKQQIVRHYMLPAILKEFSLSEKDVNITDEIISYFITATEEEQGVRNLKRSLEEVVSQVNLHKLLKKEIFENTPLNFPIDITKEMIDKFVQKKTTNTSLPMMYL